MSNVYYRGFIARREGKTKWRPKSNVELFAGYHNTVAICVGNELVGKCIQDVYPPSWSGIKILAEYSAIYSEANATTVIKFLKDFEVNTSDGFAKILLNALILYLQQNKRSHEEINGLLAEMKEKRVALLVYPMELG